MLTLIYRRDPLGFTLVCIAAYVLAMGLGNGLSERLGAAYSGNALLAALFIAALIGWSGKGGLRRTLGLCRPRIPARRVLWYAPLAAVDACNLLGGLGRVSWPETAIAAAAMLCAGVLEEILFRGLLLGALMPRGLRRAVWLSALAFGLVHALNLLGGAGAGETAAQIVCACAVGVMACAAHAALRKHPARRGDARRAQRAERSYRARRRREKSPDRRAHDGACRRIRAFSAPARGQKRNTRMTGSSHGGFR